MNQHSSSTLAHVGFMARRIEPQDREIVATLDDLRAAQGVRTSFLDACAQQAAREEWFKDHRPHDLGRVRLLDCARGMPQDFTVRDIAGRSGAGITGTRKGLEDLVTRGLLTRRSLTRSGKITYFYTFVTNEETP
jgi:hypothetical protein